MSVSVPESLAATADVAGNGELFWPGNRAAEAARWIANQGLAILGGEVYRLHAVGWASYVGCWYATPQEANELWEHYVARALERALAAVGEAAASDSRHFFATAPHKLIVPAHVTRGNQARQRTTDV